MKKTALLFSLLIVLTMAGCGAPDNPLDPEEQVLSQDSNGNFVLWVSNQSFDTPLVEIKITIDGKTAVSSTFEVKNQHNWIKHTFQLAPGKHVLKAVSVQGEVLIEGPFKVQDRLWGVVNFWHYTEGGGNMHLEFRTQNTPILFI